MTPTEKANATVMLHRAGTRSSFSGASGAAARVASASMVPCSPSTWSMTVSSRERKCSISTPRPTVVEFLERASGRAAWLSLGTHRRVVHRRNVNADVSPGDKSLRRAP
jgi:hypothetical protein